MHSAISIAHFGNSIYNDFTTLAWARLTCTDSAHKMSSLVTKYFMFDCASFLGFGRHFIQDVQSKMCWRRDLQNLFGSSHYIKRRQVFHQIPWIPLTTIFSSFEILPHFSLGNPHETWGRLSRGHVKPKAAVYPEMTSHGASKVKIPFKTASRAFCDVILVWTRNLQFCLVL